MGPGPARGIDGTPFVIDGIEFVPAWDRASQVDSLTLLKAERLIAPYRELFAPFSRPNVVELGISQGGSVALLALLARPRKLVAVELSPTPIDALAETLARHGLDGHVRPRYGVDQADGAALRRIVADEFGAEPLDVVIDDASHLYAPTLASFEVLFPRLRPGGLYVIEDWTWQDTLARNVADLLGDDEVQLSEDDLALLTADLEGRAPRERPLSQISIEAVLACAQSGEAVASVRTDEDWTVLVRGPAELDPEGFRLADLYVDRFGILVDD